MMSKLRLLILFFIMQTALSATSMATVTPYDAPYASGFGNNTYEIDAAVSRQPVGFETNLGVGYYHSVGNESVNYTTTTIPSSPSLVDRGGGIISLLEQGISVDINIINKTIYGGGIKIHYIITLKEIRDNDVNLSIDLAILGGNVIESKKEVLYPFQGVAVYQGESYLPSENKLIILKASAQQEEKRGLSWKYVRGGIPLFTTILAVVLFSALIIGFFYWKKKKS